MLLAEDVLLLATDDQTGRASRYPELLVAAALLTDLMLAGNVRLTEQGETNRKNKVVVVPDEAWPIDPLLVEAMTTLARKNQWVPATAVEALSKKLLDKVYERLVRAELLTRQDDRVLGLFPYKRWLKVSTARVDDLRARLDAVYLLGASPDGQIAAIGALLAGTDQLVKLLDRGRGIDRKHVKQVGKQLLADYWPAQALKKARENRDTAAAAAAG